MKKSFPRERLFHSGAGLPIDGMGRGKAALEIDGGCF